MKPMNESESAKKVILLGSTGSIGTQVVDIAKKHPERIEIVGLAAGSRDEILLEQAIGLGVNRIVLGLPERAKDGNIQKMEGIASGEGGFFGTGYESILRLIAQSDADIVVNALVGSLGLKASYETLKANKKLALANKESLVVGGDLIMPLVYELNGAQTILCDNTHLLPIDSEHGAIFQCLIGEDPEEVSKLWVTASGGPFRGKSADELSGVTPELALSHPTWNMGPKITIDSSTLMNKGLEVIEAHHLFNMPYGRIDVVVQPQSAIHSMVEFNDGSVKAHLGTTDMRIPIQYSLSFPKRWESPVSPLDFKALGSLDFFAPDTETFKCLKLARVAGVEGGTLPCAMNAANEVAVAAFLNRQCSFLDIANCVEHVMDSHMNNKVASIDQLLEVDRCSRECARNFLKER